MRLATGAMGAVLLCFLGVESAGGQAIGAWVLPQGTARISAGGEYTSFGTVFTQAGRQRLGAGLGSPLVADNFAPLQPLDTRLRSFFAATGQADAELISAGVTLGTPDIAVHISRVRVPVRVDIAPLPRVQIGAGVPITRGRQLVQRLGLRESGVGPNPNPTANSALLGELGPEAAALGASALLPTQNTALGEELQRRVEAFTGRRLELPVPLAGVVGPNSPSAVLAALLQDPLGFPPIESGMGLWQVGDLEVDAAIALLDPLAGRFAPAGDNGVLIRATVSAGARFPTAQGEGLPGLFPRDADVGLSGFRGGGVVDLLIGERHWWTIAAQQIVLSPARVARRVFDPAAPLGVVDDPVELRWTPGDTLQVRVTARVRLAEVISFGPEYRFERATGSTFEAAGGALEPVLEARVMNTRGGSGHVLGLTARFTSLIPYAEDRGDLPLDVAFSYSRRLGGPPGAPGEGGFRATGSVFIPIWGRALRD